MTHFSDAIRASDVDRSEPMPSDVCLDCGVEIPAGEFRCAACELVAEADEIAEFEDVRRG